MHYARELFLKLAVPASPEIPDEINLAMRAKTLREEFPFLSGMIRGLNDQARDSFDWGLSVALSAAYLAVGVEVPDAFTNREAWDAAFKAVDDDLAQNRDQVAERVKAFPKLVAFIRTQGKGDYTTGVIHAWLLLHQMLPTDGAAAPSAEQAFDESSPAADDETPDVHEFSFEDPDTEQAYLEPPADPVPPKSKDGLTDEARLIEGLRMLGAVPDVTEVALRVAEEPPASPSEPSLVVSGRIRRSPVQGGTFVMIESAARRYWPNSVVQYQPLLQEGHLFIGFLLYP